MVEQADLKENLRHRISEMQQGEIQTIAMIDRGPYRVLDDEENLDTRTGASKLVTGIFAELAADLKSDDEDLITVQRLDSDIAISQKDIDWFLSQLTSKKHLIFVQCLELSTSEIKNFLLALKDKEKLADSKIFLLDLPQIEYMMLRDSLSGRIAL